MTDPDQCDRTRHGVLHGLMGLPLLFLTLLVSFRLSASGWADAANSLTSSPYTLVALVTYWSYMTSHPQPVLQAGRRRSTVTAFYWLGSSLLVFNAAFFMDMVCVRWLEVLSDSMLVLGGGASVADACQRFVLIMDPRPPPAQGTAMPEQ